MLPVHTDPLPKTWVVPFFFESTWVLGSGLVTSSPHTLNWNTR